MIEPTLHSTHLVLGSWAAEVESDNTQCIKFLNGHFKQGAVDRHPTALAAPRVRITFRAHGDTGAFASNGLVADDALEVNETPNEVRLATPLIRARAIRQDGRVQADVALQLDGAPQNVLDAHLTVIIRRLLLWMDLFYLHAGAVEWSGTASLFVGDKGAGKSTSCLWLAKAGARLISEDHILVRRDGDDYVVSGSEIVGRVTAHSERHLFATPLPIDAQDFAGSMKKEFSLADHFNCAPGVDYRFDRIFFPSVGNDFAIEPLSEIHAALRLMADARQFFRFPGANDQRRFLDFFTGMVAGCRVYSVTLTPRLQDLDRLVDVIRHG